MDLKRQHAFKRWAPDIGENRDLPGGPGLWFELATGLSAEQLSAIRERMARPVPDSTDEAPAVRLAALKEGIRTRYLEAFGEYVRIVDGPHTIAGKPLATLTDYLVIVEEQADMGQLAIKDLFAALLSFNTFSGGDELFLQRRSGGLASTARPSVVTVRAVDRRAKKKRGR